MKRKKTPEEIQKEAEDKEKLKAEKKAIKEADKARKKRERLDKRNKKLLSDRIAKTSRQYIQSLKASLNNTEYIGKIDLSKKIKGQNRRAYLGQIVKDILNLNLEDKQIYISQSTDGKQYALNRNFINVILDYINGDIRTTNYGKESDAEIEDIMEEFLTDEGEIYINIKPITHQYAKKKGAFFPYYNKSLLNLEKYQITKGDAKYYKNNKELNILAENCLIYSLKMLGMKNDKLNLIKEYVKNQNVILNDLKTLCGEVNVKINIYQMRKNGDSVKEIKTAYGTNENETYNIALHSGHYFIYEVSEYTAFFIENYNKLKCDKNPYTIYKIRDGIYRRDYKRRISSLKLIQLLTENKETFLIKIDNLTINDYDKQFNNKKLKTDFSNFSLEYDELADEKREIFTKRWLTEDEKALKTIKDLNKKNRVDDYDSEELIELLEYDDEEQREKITKKKTKTSYKNILFADFETLTDDKNNITADMICGRLYNKDDNLIKTIYKDKRENDFIKAFLTESIKENTIIYFHNAKFDYNFIITELRGSGEIINSGCFISHSGLFNKYRVIIKDSYKIITSKLADFNKIFKNIKNEKEYINHQFYNINDIYTKPLYRKEDFLEQFNPESKIYNQVNKYSPETADIVYKNCERLNLIDENGLIDALKYRAFYCKLDVDILAEGMLTIRKMYKEELEIDIYDKLTTPSIAYELLEKNEVFKECYELTGHLREFCELAIKGGRVHSRNGEKIHIKDKLNDYDCTSLYPSAMVRIEGFPKGKPKVLNDLEYDNIKNYDYFILEVKIININIKRTFPLQSYKDNKGTRIYSNDLNDKIIYVDKIELEDLIKYQDVNFQIIKGYYWNEGFNTNIKELIQKLFNTRKQLKAEENPREVIYKLILNSAYGKLIQKAHDTETKIISGNKNIDTFLSRNYNEIKCYTKYDTREGMEKARIEKTAGRKLHYNFPHLGAYILSMSKRIMNEVITTAEDNNLNIYYQDTDSIHLKSDDLTLLKELFLKKYNRNIEGKNLGEFHSDLEMNENKNIKNLSVYSTELVVIDKKTYLHKIEGKDIEGNTYNGGYMIRSKGISREAISHYIDEYNKDKTANEKMNYMGFYKKLYNQEAIKCDLAGGGNICKLNINLKNNKVEAKKTFYRTLHFPKEPVSVF